MKQKLEKVAKDYIRAHTTYMLYDCCDAMRDLDRYEAQWSILTDDKLDIKEYIEENLEEFFQKEVRSVINDFSGEVDYQEVLDDACGDLLFPLK